MNPGQIAVGAGKVIELRLLSDPENAVGHHAHQKNDEARQERNQRMPEIALGMNGFAGGHTQIENEQGHRYREDSVAQRCKAFYALSGNTVVEGWHRMKFNGLWKQGQNRDAKATTLT